MGMTMTPYERECNAENDARRAAEIEDELRRISTWDVGPNPMPAKLAQRREELKRQLGR